MNEFFDNLDKLPWWQLLLIGGAIWFAIQNFVVPDKQAIWLAQRKNGLTALAPVFLVVLAIAVFNLIAAFFSSVHFSWKPASLETWVVVFLLFGLVGVTAYVIQQKANHKSILPRMP